MALAEFWIRLCPQRKKDLDMEFFDSVFSAFRLNK